MLQQHIISKSSRIWGIVAHLPPCRCVAYVPGRRHRSLQQQHQLYQQSQYQAGCYLRLVPFSSSAVHHETIDSSSSSTISHQGSSDGSKKTSKATTTSIDTDESEYGLFRLLTKEKRSLLHEQRRLTQASRQVAAQVMALGLGRGGGTGVASTMDSKSSSSFLEDLHLQSTFSVVIAGEFNAGKSTLINALLGRKLLETGALPTTDSITIVAGNNYGTPSVDDLPGNDDVADRRQVPLGVVIHSVPDLPLLEDLTLIDSPGTNSTWMDHTERTMRLLPAADMILFVTSADRPFSESERTLLRSIEAYRKSIVVVVNKMDILDLAGGNHGEDQKRAVVDFVTDRASELLGARPVVIPVSARDALSAKLMAKTTPTFDHDDDGDDRSHNQHRSNVWTRSNFSMLESFLKESLTAQAKVKSKLSNPLGVADGVMNECLSIIRTQRDDLQVDVATLNIFQSQFEGWKKELVADMTMSRSAMTDMVRQEGQRCQILTNRMTWYNFYYWTLIDTPQLHKEWEGTKREIAIFRNEEDLKAALMEQVLETADSVATRGRAQGQAAIEYLGKRPAMKNQSLIGSVTAASRFEDTRKALVDRLSSVLDLTIQNDKEQELELSRLFQSFRQTASVSAALHVGALGSTLLIALDLLDPVLGGICCTLFVAGGAGSYILGTARITRQFEHDWTQRAQTMDKALEAICSKELDRVNQRILAGVAPYTRFVESEQSRLHDLQMQCEGIQSAARSLLNRINKMT